MHSLLFIILSSLFIGYLDLPERNEVELWKYDDLENYIKHRDGKVLVVNFWATWCGPCIKEMPYFEQLAENYSSEVTVLFVSLDFADLKDKKVIPFIEKKNINSKVVILDDGNYNEWIDKVSKDWSGAIPGTLFVDKERYVRKFYEQEFTYETLEEKFIAIK